MGERLALILEHVRASGTAFTDAEVAVHFAAGEVPLERHKENLANAREALGDFELRSVRSPDPQVAVAIVESDGRRWQLGVRIEKRPPYRIRNFLRCELKPGLEIRPATEADAAALRELELQTPIVLGETTVVYDRGEDYFAAERLMGDVGTYVIEQDGRPVGLTSSVFNAIRANGRAFVGSYRHRLRVLPEARGQGVSQLLNFHGFEANSWRGDYPYSFVAAGNSKMQRSHRSGWSVRPSRIVMDTAKHTLAAFGRPATPADSARIVELLNATHEGEELFVRYTEQTLAERLNREPTLYSWRHLRLSEHAVLGVWPAHLNVVRETAGSRTTDDRALVLDYGFEPGAEDEFVALVQAECGMLAEVGITELPIFSCLPSAAHAPLAALAKRVEPYVFILYLLEPDDLASRGIYVDQLYF